MTKEERIEDGLKALRFHYHNIIIDRTLTPEMRAGYLAAVIESGVDQRLAGWPSMCLREEIDLLHERLPLT